MKSAVFNLCLLIRNTQESNRPPFQVLLQSRLLLLEEHAVLHLVEIGNPRLVLKYVWPFIIRSKAA